MKRIMFLFLLLISSSIYATSQPPKIAVNYQPTTSALVKSWLTHFFIGGVSLLALGEILTDMGHRYLFSKATAIRYTKELRYDGRAGLTENEISFWAFIHGLSTIPRIWWREITATALTIAFIHIAYQTLLQQQQTVESNPAI